MGLSVNLTEKFTGEENAWIVAKQVGQTGPLRLVGSRNSMNQVVGRSVTRHVIRHFQTYSASHPNKLGGKRTNYVAKMGDATSFQANSDGVTISIAHEGARLRIEGGTITPKNGKKYLTIPAIAEAYGKSAREFPNLTIWLSKSKRPIALVETDATKIDFKLAKRLKFSPNERYQYAKATGGRVVFWLVRSANIPANRNLLPTDDEILTTALTAIHKWIGLKGGQPDAAVA